MYWLIIWLLGYDYFFHLAFCYETSILSENKRNVTLWKSSKLIFFDQMSCKMLFVREHLVSGLPSGTAMGLVHWNLIHGLT